MSSGRWRSTPRIPTPIAPLGGILLMKSRFDEAVEAARKAVKLGPNLPDVLVFASYVLTCSGQAAEAVALSEKAMSLSPTYPANYLGQLGNTYRLAGRSDDALKAFQAYRARSPGYGLVDMVMIHAQAGRMDEARSMAARIAGCPAGLHGRLVAGDAIPQRSRSAGDRRGLVPRGRRAGRLTASHSGCSQRRTGSDDPSNVASRIGDASTACICSVADPTLRKPCRRPAGTIRACP